MRLRRIVGSIVLFGGSLLAFLPAEAGKCGPNVIDGNLCRHGTGVSFCLSVGDNCDTATVWLYGRAVVRVP